MTRVLQKSLRNTGYKTENEKWNQNGGIQWSPERHWKNQGVRASHEAGRFPANLLVSDDVLDDGKQHKSGKAAVGTGNSKSEHFGVNGIVTTCYADTGGYSRFFSLDAWVERNLPFLIIPKPSRREKEMGLTGFDEKKVNDGRNKAIDNAFQRGETHRRNTNPCVKQVKLMAYLIMKGSRENDVVLDPYCGSGSTCMAAKLLNRRYIGIEISPEYHEIAVSRIDSVEPIKSMEKTESSDAAAGQETNHGVSEDGDDRRPARPPQRHVAGSALHRHAGHELCPRQRSARRAGRARQGRHLLLRAVQRLP